MVVITNLMAPSARLAPEDSVKPSKDRPGDLSYIADSRLYRACGTGLPACPVLLDSQLGQRAAHAHLLGPARKLKQEAAVVLCRAPADVEIGAYLHLQLGQP